MRDKELLKAYLNEKIKEVEGEKKDFMLFLLSYLQEDEVSNVYADMREIVRAQAIIHFLKIFQAMLEERIKEKEKKRAQKFLKEIASDFEKWKSERR